MIINVCYTVFYNVKLGISFPHRGLWSTRFVWDSDSNWAASVVPPCSQSDPGTGPAAIPAPRPWGCTEGGNRVYKVPATSWINRSPTHTKEWLNYLVKHFWQPCLRTARVVRAELSWVRCWAGWIWALSLPMLGTEVGLVSSKLETEKSSVIILQLLKPKHLWNCCASSGSVCFVSQLLLSAERWRFWSQLLEIWWSCRGPALLVPGQAG